MAKERILRPVSGEKPTLFPKELWEKERKREGWKPRIGVALSGGGIRSATLSLGFFQGLARRRLVSSIDYLSTVSGGGYFGGFFGHLLQRKAKELTDNHEEVPADLADQLLGNAASPAMRYLRENGRYLSPNGSGDLLAGFSVALRNWTAVIIVIGLLSLALLTAATMLRFGILDALPSRLTDLTLPRPWDLVSPFLLVAPIAILALAVPPSWAYWLVRDNPQTDGVFVAIAKWIAPAAGVASGLWVLWRHDWSFPAATPGLGLAAQWAMLVVSVLSALTILRYAVGRLGAGRETHKLRRHLSRGLTRALVVIAVLVAVGVVDSIGQNIADPRAVGVMGVLAMIGGILRKQILAFATRAKPNVRSPLPTGIVMYLAAFVLIVGMLGIIAAIPHVIAHRSPSPLIAPENWFRPVAWLLGVTAALVLAVSRVWSFINRSSLHAVYEARLRRAYLGASNPARSGEFEDRPAVTEPHADDGMTWKDYNPSKHSGPIHIINVTVNETVDGKSHIQQRDRKGMGLAVGPAGISVGAIHHALWDEVEQQGALARFQEASSTALSKLWRGVRRAVDGLGRQIRGATPGAEEKPAEPLKPARPFRIFASNAKPELLDVGQWIAISGGAVSTGLGARTNLALSLLTGFFNVRLGYWWSSGVNPKDRDGETARTPLQNTLAFLRRQLPVQFALLDEWLARFPGVSREEWYLTDGGHFENLGGYELLRRRLPFIVVCDNEQDRDYHFDGLANLVRKARTDLDAEITFLSDRELADARDLQLPDCIGSLDSLRRGGRSVEMFPGPMEDHSRIIVDGDRTRLSLKHAALARIAYGAAQQNGGMGWLLYVKPSLDGDESIDVLRYHTENPDFPHESTGDQFFDEAQWESYRKLGEHIALKVFDGRPGPSWHESLTLGDELEASRTLSAILDQRQPQAAAPTPVPSNGGRP